MANQREENNAEKYIQWVNAMLSLTIRVYDIFIRLAIIVASQICEIPQHSPKILTYSSQ